MNVEDLIQIRIAEAARRVEADKERRARIEAARAAGLHYRRRDRLAHIAERQGDDLSTTEPTQPEEVTRSRNPSDQPQPATAPGSATVPPQSAQQPAHAPEPQPATHKPPQPQIPDVSVTTTETTR